MIANYLQLRYQRQEIQYARAPSPGLVLNLITRRLETAGRRRRDTMRSACGPSSSRQQRKISFTVGNIQNVAGGLRRRFPVLSSIAIFYIMLGEQAGRRAGPAGADHRRVHRLQRGLRPVPRRHAGARRRLAEPAPRRADLRAHQADPRARRRKSIRAKGFPGRLDRRDRRSRTSSFRYDAGRAVDHPRRVAQDQARRVRRLRRRRRAAASRR